MKVLAVSPHADDVEFSISGILCKLMEDYEIDILYNTKYDLFDQDNSLGHEERIEEIKDACKLLGAKYEFFSIQDTIEELAKQLLKINPTIIFLPYPNDTNRIHLRVCQLYLDVIEAATKMQDDQNTFNVAQLFYYQSYSSVGFEPDIIVDVTNMYSKARNILLCHKAGIRILPSLIYKFQLLHQINGFGCSCLYGEGLVMDKNSPYCWKNNRRIGIKMLCDIL